MTIRRLLFSLLLALLTYPSFAAEFSPQDFWIGFSDGRSPLNKRGHSIFQTLHLEVSGHSRFIDRHLPRTEAGASISYSDITQARSWFGYAYGDPDDRVRGQILEVFLRHRLPWQTRSVKPFVQIGTGPMWSNRRVPAATSRFNMNSQMVVGADFFAASRFPVRIGYRFSHVSNAGIASRNPGLNVHQATIAVKVRTFGL